MYSLNKIGYIWNMASLQIDILDPKAGKILKQLADKNLIAITELNDNENFLKVVRKVRARGKKNPISLDDITKEIGAVRSKRHAKTKR
jgi:hypothetical protein